MCLVNTANPPAEVDSNPDRTRVCLQKCHVNTNLQRNRVSFDFAHEHSCVHPSINLYAVREAAHACSPPSMFTRVFGICQCRSLQSYANRRNIVGQLQRTLLGSTCCVRLHGTIKAHAKGRNKSQHCCVFLGIFGQQCCIHLHGPKSLTGFKLYATNANKCQHCCGFMQPDATCWVQQCCVLFANNVASVCMGLNIGAISPNISIVL